MTDLIELAKGKLDDSIIRQWAIRQYSAHIDHSPAVAEEMLSSWFDDLSLSKWLKAENESHLSRLFSALPTERFQGIHKTIMELWLNWVGADASNSISTLIQNSKEKEEIVALIQQHIEANFGCCEKTLGVISHLGELPETLALPILSDLIDKTFNLPNDARYKLYYLSGLFSLAVQLNPDVSDRILQKLIELEKQQDRIIKSLCYALNHSDSFFELAKWIREGYSSQRFESLSRLFLSHAPLAKVDELLKFNNPLPDSLALLKDVRAHSATTQLAHHLFSIIKNNIVEESSSDFSCLILATVLFSFVDKTIDVNDFSLEETVTLLSADLTKPIRKDSLVNHLKTFNSHDIEQAIKNRFSVLGDSYGAIHLSEMIGELSISSLIPELIHSLNEDAGDYLCEAAREALIKLGEPAQKAIIEQWGSLDFSQKIYGSGVISDIGGKNSVDFAIAHFDTLFFDNPERWCDLALAMPDRRVIELLNPQIKRQQYVIDEAYYVLCKLLNHETNELPVIHERILKKEKEQQERLASLSSSGVFANQQLDLLLRCKSCGVENQYDVKQIYTSSNSDFPFLIVDEFPCVSCDSWAGFELTSAAIMAVSAQMMIMASNNTQVNDSSVIKSLNCLFRGKQISVPEVIGVLEASINQANDIADYLDLAKVNYMIGRLKKAREMALHTVEIEPNAMEAGLTLAIMDDEAGDKDKAFHRLQSLLTHKDSWKFYRQQYTQPSVLGKEFARLYNKLLKTQHNKNIPMLHEAFIGNRKKIGRNDPCSCGSGKKFKKCCLLKV